MSLDHSLSPALPSEDASCLTQKHFEEWLTLRSTRTHTKQWEAFNHLIGRIFAKHPSTDKATQCGTFSKLVDALKSTEILSCAFFGQYFLELCTAQSDDDGPAISDREFVKLTKAVVSACNWHKLLENIYYAEQESAQTQEAFFMPRGEYNTLVAKAVVLAAMHSSSGGHDIDRPFQTRMQALVGALTKDTRSAAISLLFSSEVSRTVLRSWASGHYGQGLVFDGGVEKVSTLVVWRRLLLLFSGDVCVSETVRLLSSLKLTGVCGSSYTTDVDITSATLLYMCAPYTNGVSIAATAVVPKLESLLSVCFSLASDEQDLAVCIETLLLPKTGPYLDPAVTRFVARFCLPRCFILPVADIVLASWGNKQLLSAGCIGSLASSTGILLALLSFRMTEADLTSIPPPGSDKGPLLRGVPLSILFSQAVSLYLDLSDRALRAMGLRVAVAFSALLGQPLTFAELETNEAAAAPPTDRISPPREKPNTTAIFRQKLGLLELSDSSDSDSDSDCSSGDDESESGDAMTDGCGIGANSVPPKVKAFMTTYLRVCLELLQCQEPAPETHYKHNAALLSIPTIVARGPVDINDLCVPLLLELIRLGNEFAMRDFDELKSAAVHALLFRYPRLAMPALAHQIQSEALTLGGKIEVLGFITKAAYALAGLSHLYDAEYIGQTASASVSRVSGAASAGEEEGSGSMQTMVRERGQATIIKRPRTLERLHAGTSSRVLLFRNEFVDLLDLFLAPIMSTLYAAELDAGRLLRLQSETAGAEMRAGWTPSRKPAGGLIQVVATDGEEEEEEEGKGEEETGGVVPSAAAPTSSTPRSSDIDISAPIVAILAGDCTESPSPLPGFQVHSARLAEGLNTLLPAHCLIALSGLVHCCINSTRQRALIQQTLLLCGFYKAAESLALRRACLLALHTAIESWKYLKLNSHRYKSRSSGATDGNVFATTAMRELCDVMHLREYFDQEDDSSCQSIPVDSDDFAVCALVEWCAMSLTSEADAQCRAMKVELIRLVQDVL